MNALAITNMRTHRNRFLNRRISAFICVICGSILSMTSAFADSIRLHDQAGSAGPGIRLVQIAELEGDYAQSLADLEIARFAEPTTTSLRIQLATVRRVLTEAQVNWADLSLKGYNACDVARVSNDETVDQVVQNDRAVTTNQELAVPTEPGRTVSDLVIDEIVRLNAARRDDLEITFRGEAGQAGWLNRSAMVGRYELDPLSRSGLGLVPVKVRRFDPAGTVEEATLYAEVARKVFAVVATDAIRRGEPFTNQNVSVQEVLLTGEHGETLESASLVIGQTASASLREGAIVKASHVSPDQLIKRGELVTVTCVSGSLVIRTVGRASEDGVRDDIIAIKNEQTRETYYATVTGRRQASIEPGSVMTASLDEETPR